MRDWSRGARTAAARWLYPHALLAAVTFLAGTALGAGAMATTSPDALASAAEAFGNPDLFPDRLTTWSIFSNNVVALAVLAAGSVSFGLTAAFGLLFNGLILGTVGYLSANEGSLAVTIALVLPHGVLELGAFFVVGGIAYRITWRLVSYLRGRADRPLTRGEAREAVALAFAAVLVLAVAAWIEANLTVPIARALLGEAAVSG